MSGHGLAGDPGRLPAAIELDRDELGGFDVTRRREWLFTNGIGGFAAGTVSFVNTRRYHGLLFAALRPPVERVALVAKLEVTVRYGDSRLQLATNEFLDGTIAPHGYCHLESFRLEGLVPVWTWLIAEARLEQRLWMYHGENTTYVQFTRTPVRINPVTYWNFKHREESARGLDEAEDLLRPSSFEIDLKPGDSRSMILSAETHELMPAADALVVECRRQADLADRFNRVRAGASPVEFAHIDRFALAAEQFMVERRDPSGERLGKTVIAGYPWFSDWGRDTMIAPPGLTLATGRPEIAVSRRRSIRPSKTWWIGTSAARASGSAWIRRMRCCRPARRACS